jgi:hypothetical protein
MRPERSSDEVYRAAFDFANRELTEISAEFERLTIRKDKVEKLLVALQPFIAIKEALPASSVPVIGQSAPKNAGAAEPSEPKRELEPTAADPFKRRTDHALGIGAGIRDVRKYTRQF